MREFPLDKVFQLLEPGPVVLVSTSENGRDNVMTMSWHMMMDFVPPRLACVISEGDHSFQALAGTRECVLAIPPASLAATVVDIGNCSGAQVDKFKAFGLTRKPAAAVAAPLINECFANLECRVADDTLVEKYDLFVLEVVRAWADEAWPELASTSAARALPKTLHHNGDGTFRVDGEMLDMKARMRKFPEFL
ncbi:MAG: flavin reductase [Desulfovibrionaceae bacterium CG1_02_65_16]|nr:MAG: flavin reductase [Desulfovibrionaceae bacterium CG1_02_65_16]